jgi:hypothetical protein
VVEAGLVEEADVIDDVDSERGSALKNSWMWIFAPVPNFLPSSPGRRYVSAT